MLIQESKDGLNSRSPLSTKLIYTYKRRREKKEKTYNNSKKIQFFIEDKG